MVIDQNRLLWLHKCTKHNNNSGRISVPNFVGTKFRSSMLLHRHWSMLQHRWWSLMMGDVVTASDRVVKFQHRTKSCKKIGTFGEWTFNASMLKQRSWNFISDVVTTYEHTSSWKIEMNLPKRLVQNKVYQKDCHTYVVRFGHLYCNSEHTTRTVML